VLLELPIPQPERRRAAAQQQAGRREFFSFMGVYSGENPLPPLFFYSMAGIDSGDEIPAVPGQ
jgi:hypothetical protein